MDFSYDQRFTSEKAGGIGVVIIAHVLLAGALVYCFQTMTVPKHNDGPVVFTPEPPTPIVKPIDPPKSSEPHPQLPQVYIPPVEIPNPPAPVISPIVVSTPIEPEHKDWTSTKGGNVPHDSGAGSTVIHSSSPLIANLNDCKPSYPQSARMNEEEGTVRLKMDIGANGQLLGASVVKSSGFNDLDRAAVRGLSQCAFKAATQDGTPIQSSLVTDYVWSLQ